MSPIDRPMRLALAQIDTTVGDVDGNAAKIREYIDLAADAGAQVAIFPELAINGYPPEDLLLKTHFLAAGRRALDSVARDVQGHGGAGRVRRACGGRLQLARGAGRRPGAGDLPQDVPAQLRRVRRAALLPGRRCPGGDPGRRHDDRPHGLRGHLGARPAGQRRGARGRGGDREHLRLAVPPRQGHPARADAGAARPGQPRLCRLLQPGRRPGRARVRRLQPGRGPGRRAGRARRAVRRGADRVRHRPVHGRCGPPARRPPSAGGASAAPGGRRTLRTSRPPRATRRPPSAAPRQAARARRGGLRGALPRAARLRRQERVRARAARPLGRDRLGAHRVRRGRRARLRAGRVRGDALPPLLRRRPSSDARQLADNLGVERFELRARAR